MKRPTAILAWDSPQLTDLPHSVSARFARDSPRWHKHCCVKRSWAARRTYEVKPTTKKLLDVGDAPSFWGVSEREYRSKADVYPINPEGELASVFIVESEKAIANSREITRVRPTVAIPGPGTLSRVYNRDKVKVEAAIQTQLASCKEFGVPCGITAGPADVAKRIKEGFRVIIIYDRDYAATIAIGREVAGRN